MTNHAKVSTIKERGESQGNQENLNGQDKLLAMNRPSLLIFILINTALNFIKKNYVSQGPLKTISNILKAMQLQCLKI